MTEYESSFERKEKPEDRKGVFGLGKLTNEEVIDLGRGVNLSNENESKEHPPNMLDLLFLNDLSGLAKEDPMRAEDLLFSFKEYGTSEAMDMAIMFAPKVVEANYQLATSVLIEAEHYEDFEVSHLAAITADQLEENLPEELVEDFRKRRREAQGSNGQD